MFKFLSFVIYRASNPEFLHIEAPAEIDVPPPIMELKDIKKLGNDYIGVC